MSELRNLCGCGHVRRSHPEDGHCRTGACSCAGWKPAYLVYDEMLPLGVEPVRGYRSGLTLVECGHAAEFRLPNGACSWCHLDAARVGQGLRVKRLVFAPAVVRLF